MRLHLRPCPCPVLSCLCSETPSQVIGTKFIVRFKMNTVLMEHYKDLVGLSSF